MKFRIYRQIMRIEYIDVEAKTEEEALKYHTKPSEEFKTTDDGYITDYLITTDLSKEFGKIIFTKRDLERWEQNNKDE